MAGHTSIIHIHLEVKGELFKITHLGGGFFRLKDAPKISVGAAKIHVITDGRERITDIVVNEDIPAGSRQRNYYTTKKALENVAQETSEPSVPELVSA